MLHLAVSYATALTHEGEMPLRPGAAAVVIHPALPYEGPVRDDMDEYGGWLGLKGTATGFFHTEQVGGRWWLITPKGNVFFILGMGGGPRDGDADRLRALGFNGAYGGYYKRGTEGGDFPYMLDLKFLRLARRELPIEVPAGQPPWATFPDVFDPEWMDECERYAQIHLKPVADDPLMIGYWIDNEPTFEGWYEAATRTDPDSPARRAFVEVARAYYADKPEQLPRDWAAHGAETPDDLQHVNGAPPAVPGLAEAWEVAVAEQAFSTIYHAARRAAPNHLNLGIRMLIAVPPSPGVLSVMGKYSDTISLNMYNLLSDRLLPQIFTITPLLHAATERPLLISEFSFRGADTICPGTLGAPPMVATQTDRAVGYLSYVSSVASLPFFVGATWYMYQDDSPMLPWDAYGEDCNFGIVDSEGRRYAVLTETMRATNAAIFEIAADPVRNENCPVFWRTELTRWDKQYTQKFLQRIGGIDGPIFDPLADTLPSDRSFHANYWVHHRSPSLTVNDFRFVGACKANMVRKREDGQELVLLGITNFTSFPRSLWYGEQCEHPEAPLNLEANVQFLHRELDANGRVRRMRMADGSFVRLERAELQFRTDYKVPYLDLQYDHDSQTLDVITRGAVNHLGVRGVHGWTVAWNGEEVQPAPDISPRDDVTVFAYPGS